MADTTRTPREDGDVAGAPGRSTTRDGEGSRVLVVEDFAPFARTLRRSLTGAGHRVRVAENFRRADDLLSAEPVDVVLLDLCLPDGRGEDLLPRLERLSPRPRVVVISGRLTAARILSLQRRCAAILNKPVDYELLLDLVAKLRHRQPKVDVVASFCRRHRLSRRESQLLRLTVDGAGGEEAAAQLACKPGTVTTYWQRIFAKTDRRSQKEVIARLVQFVMDGSGGAP